MAQTNRPLVSVIIPVYNVERYLDRCVNSIVNQTYKNLEIFLVDDGSPDSSPRLCDNWAEKDSRIQVIHKKNGGPSQSRNVALDIACGDYILFVDSDDYMELDAIQKMYDRIVLDGSDMAICDYVSFCDGDNSVYDTVNNPRFTDSILSTKQAYEKLYELKGNMHLLFTVPWAKLYKKYIWDSLRYPVGILHEDIFVSHLVIEKCNTISCVSGTFYYYYQNDSSIMHNYSAKRLTAIDGYYERYKFFFEKKEYSLAQTSLIFALNHLSYAYKQLGLKDENIRLKLKAYKKRYNKFFKQILFKHTNIKMKVKLSAFYFSPSLFVRMF